MADTSYRSLVAHYERCLDEHGPTHRGVDWPNEADARARYRVMLDLLPDDDEPKSLLDFGCGAGHLYDELLALGRTDVRYRGLDASERFVEAAIQRHPTVRFDVADVLAGDGWDGADYIVMNGVFTEKRSLEFEAMYRYLFDVLECVWTKTRAGLAFNVMSKVVDWERDDLFHVPMDRLVTDLSRRLSRHVTVRQDYGLYEYTVYVRTVANR